MRTFSLNRCARLALSLLALLNVPAAAAQPPLSLGGMLSRLPQDQADNPLQAKARTALDLIARRDLPGASRAINEALQLSPRNSYLHFLNGIVYHLQAREGDSARNELAVEGYQQALRIDPGNWIAREFLGLALLEQRKLGDAGEQFAEVLLMTDSSVASYGAMVAAYLAGDASTACAMADRYRQLAAAPGTPALRSLAAVYASCARFDRADAIGAQLASLGGAPGLERRLGQWRTFHAQQALPLAPASLTAAPLQLAQAFTLPASRPPSLQAPGAAPAAPRAADPAAPREAPAGSAPPSESGPRMVLVDVVLVSAQELVTTSKGVNLLGALTLQLGSVGGNVAAFSRVRTSNSVNDAAATLATAITRAVTVPALSYSLNIANANSSVNEVLARPTLAAIEGMPSEFFSGTNLSAGVVSSSTQGGTTVVPLEKRFGIKLGVTPVFLASGRVQLKVEAQRTSLLSNADNPRVAYQVEIAEITANANVVMNLGDTLVLSGLSERVAANTRDGVPVLQDVPLMQYLFSNKKTNDLQRSVLILITPRLPAAGPHGGANAAAVMGELGASTMFRQFRESDVALERWERMDSTVDRLRQALDFLYY